MTDATPAHYPTPAARLADLIVHIVGLAFALLGGGILLGLTFGLGAFRQVPAVTIYVVGFIAMLALSSAYNFAKPRWRPLLRRLDHAGIFIMIAGSYTPFTTLRLHGAWAIGMTVVVWTAAALGITGELFWPSVQRRLRVPVYLCLGWVALVAIKPIMDDVSWLTLTLLAVGGVVYSTGAAVYVVKSLPFRRAIWHGHVVGGSVLHYLAVLLGVVLARGVG